MTGADVFIHPFPRVRAARLDELDFLIEHAGRIHEENGIGPKWDADVVRDHVTEGLIGDRNGQRRAFCAVVGDNGRIEGSMLLFLNHLWYNRDYWLLEDRWIFVLPEYRQGGRNVRDLLGFAKNWSDTLGIPLCLSILSTVRTKAKMRIFQRTLGEPAGGFFLVNAHTGH